MPPEKKISVLCVDDHRLVREGIAVFIDRQPDMRVVASAANGYEAVELHARLAPAVTLMDLQLGAMTGVQAIQAIRHASPHARIVALTTYQGEEDIYQALHAGAAAYLLKDTLSDDLIRVIRQVNRGEQPALPPDVRSRLDERSKHQPLTAREVQVVELIGLGMQNKEIGTSLGISEETVQVHVRNLLAKLGARDRTAAITVAIRRGIVHLR
jgi:two-component system NarL family response regulator